MKQIVEKLKPYYDQIPMRERSLALSAFGHILIVALVTFSGGQSNRGFGSVTFVMPLEDQATMVYFPNNRSYQGGGGGGLRAPVPATQGKLPRFSLDPQLAPPTPVPFENMALEVEPTLKSPLQPVKLDFPMFGDPFGTTGPPSPGPGIQGGIGDGTGSGIGKGEGAGLGPGKGGGFGRGVYRIGGGVSAPRLLDKVQPEYSVEARKLKYQGVVELTCEVWEDGKAHNIKVVNSLGMGLDEKAIEAVELWTFAPGKKDGKPVRVFSRVQVFFRLL